MDRAESSVTPSNLTVSRKGTNIPATSMPRGVVTLAYCPENRVPKRTASVFDDSAVVCSGETTDRRRRRTVRVSWMDLWQREVERTCTAVSLAIRRHNLLCGCAESPPAFAKWWALGWLFVRRPDSPAKYCCQFWFYIVTHVQWCIALRGGIWDRTRNT